MAAIMAIAGTLGSVALVVENLREVLKKAGIGSEDITRIISELVKRLPGGRSERGDGEPVPTPWEYSVITLSGKGFWGRARSVVPILRDGVEIPPTDLATYLNRLSTEGWEVLSAIGKDDAPSLILVRPRPGIA